MTTENIDYASYVDHTLLAMDATEMQIAKLCEEAQDYVTRDLMIAQLKDTEEDHAHWLEQQLRLIELVGEGTKCGLGVPPRPEPGSGARRWPSPATCSTSSARSGRCGPRTKASRTGTC